jgi:energy-coupling factor transporter ATP-binding protein EcfA2
VIEVRGVSYRYPGYARPALSGIDLAIADGEIVGLVGPNEAGKSTLCLVASGLAPASIGGELLGEVVVDGGSTRDMRPHDLGDRVGIVFASAAAQRSGIAGTVFEEVAIGPVNLGLPVAETVARARRALDVLGIGELAARDPARLSGGESQLVAIASIFAMGPRNLVLDEPTSELDAGGTARVAEGLRVLAGLGIAILVAEHRTEVLDSICTRVIAIDAGTIALDGPPSDVLADPALERLGVRPPDRGGDR